MSDHWKFWIDTGGTFTDCIAIDPQDNIHKTKVLSDSTLRGKITGKIAPGKFRIDHTWNLPDDFIKGYTFRRLNESTEGIDVKRFWAEQSIIELDTPVEAVLPGMSFEVTADEEAPILAIRVLTHTRLSDAFPPFSLRLATTKATNALLEKDGARLLYCTTKGFEDLLSIRYQQRPDLFALNVELKEPLYGNVLAVDERILANGSVEKSPDIETFRKRLDTYSPADFDAVAICLMNSYQNGEHEELMKKECEKAGFSYITTSGSLIRRSGIIPRAETTVVNAYLSPVMEQYINRIHRAMNEGKLLMLNSAGGLTSAESFTPKESLLSGPAGGIVGAAAIGRKAGYENVLSFDMGGTSTDVSRYSGDFSYQHEHQVGSARIAATALDIETVAAGGGSICSFDGYTLKVGPESAGAHPGPACYGAGGPLTLTDVNLLLGRIHPTNFSIPVDRNAAEDRLEEILEQLGDSQEYPPEKESVLSGFLQIANERMAKTIRKISVQQGYDPSGFALVAFGGAGGQHACAVADQMEISTVLFPRDAGLLSAYGLGHALMEEIREYQLETALTEIEPRLKNLFKDMAVKAREKLKNQGVKPDNIVVRKKLVSLRFEGQAHTLELEFDTNQNVYENFRRTYTTEFGHWIEDRSVEVESIRLIASEKRKAVGAESKPTQYQNAAPDGFTEIWLGNRFREVPFFHTKNLKSGHELPAPALVLDPNSTLIVEQGWRLQVQSDMVFELQRVAKQSKSTNLLERHSEEVALELFTNRFTAVAGEMGEMLQRTALSVNIKERHDFSCALLNARGELIVNAPHIPVHLGALGLCVRRLIETISFEPGDVVITNHPAYGGSHLPDVTIVTPVFTRDETLVGFAASRAHHAEIGGSRPGSMPPRATRLVEEGVVIAPVHIVKKGKNNWDEIRSVLTNAPHPTRSLDENIADIQAAIAANHRGAAKLRELCALHGSETVTHYMDALKNYASDKMSNTLRSIPDRKVSAIEKLDDGTILSAQLHLQGSSLAIDFNGTGNVHPGNLNATPAIVQSVVMYVLRVLVEENLPLNEGLLDPVSIRLPVCLLNPEFSDNSEDCPAIVGGNTEVSQRLVDLLLKPFERMACSQGTMNNLLFGNDNFGYYETIGGGTGAGPGFDGADGVHHHMSNTRGTDPEILEQRYPVVLEEYKIRENSGGSGLHKGGDGITRTLKFTDPVSLSVLTQHRTEKPYGLQGGSPGKQGEQFVVRKDGSRENLKSIDGSELKSGDRLIIKTPGGGGYGE